MLSSMPSALMGLRMMSTSAFSLLCQAVSAKLRAMVAQKTFFMCVELRGWLVREKVDYGIVGMSIHASSSGGVSPSISGS